MEPAEILHRLSEHRRKIVSKKRDDGWHRYSTDGLRPVFPAWRDAVLAACPEQRSAIAAVADEALKGRFSALGRQWPDRNPQLLFPAELWRLDPVTSTLWPGTDEHTFDVDYRHSNLRGDVKFVWEINRLQQLPPLAAHFVQTGDERALLAIEVAIDSWHSANPPFRGVAWASGIEVALRAISLIVAKDIAGTRLAPGTLRQIGEILAASTYWLSRFPSRFSSANNHLVAELAGEYLIAIALGRDASNPYRTLVDEVRKQILADGSGAEQAPTYAAFTAELILLCVTASVQSGNRMPPEIGARLTAFADFVDWLPRQGGSFGDDDEGRALTLGDERNYVQSVAAAIHGFFRQPGHLPSPSDFRSVLFGAPTAPLPQPRGLKTFDAGGLSVWRGEMNGRAVELVFDHGPLGYLSIAAHGHADALSIALNIDDAPVLVDPGTWLYGSGGVWRDWFRSTPAHNTLNIEGKSQSIISGQFNWSHKAISTLLNTGQEAGDWSLRAEQDGYRGRFGVVHRRTLTQSSEGIMVIDQLLGGERQAEVIFQLASGLVANAAGNAVTVLRSGLPIVSIEFPDAAIEIREGGNEPGDGGWVSPRFGVREPAARIAWRGAVAEAGVTFKIRPTNVLVN